MEKSEMINSNKEVVDEHEFQEILKSLTKETNFHSNYILYHYKGFWCPSQVIKAMLSFRKHFQPKNNDIIVASAFKSGTTWLKALTFSIINRTKYSLLGTKETPLLTNNPHSLVYNLEYEIYSQDELVTIEDIASPRILNTHAPFEALPQSMLNSKCRIVYICRNPLDQFISYWHFNRALLKNQGKTDTPTIDEAFELFCRGVHSFGPFWEHALGYWRSSIERPDKVLFLKYEDLKDDINLNVKKIAEFLEFPFTKEEENKGLVEEISELCDFENLKNLQVNKVGIQTAWLANRDFFRKGQVGDWVNYLSLPQAERLEKIANEKLSGSGLTFKSFFCKT